MGRNERYEPWEQLEDESAPAYEAFSAYRDMEASERSYAKVGQRLGKSKTLIDRWGNKYRWQERASAHDRYVDSLALKKASDDLAAMRARHIKIAKMIQTKGLKLLDRLDPDTAVIGGGIESDISYKDAVKMITDGMKIEAERAGEELQARMPSAKETAEEEAIKKLDEILGRIDSGF